MSNVNQSPQAIQYSTQGWRDRDRNHQLHPFTDLHSYAKTGGFIIARGEGIYIYDTDDNEILDGMSGLWCCNLGYSQPAIVDAVAQQLSSLPYYNSFFGCSNTPAVALAETLTTVMPEGFSRFFFTSSGSEANDTNIRIVHRYFELLGKPNKKQFISRTGAYHGSTIASASLGGMSLMHQQVSGIDYVQHIRQPHWYKEGGDLSPDAFGLAVARELEAKIDEIGEDQVAAFIAEPIQGAGGVIVPPATYWPEIQRICNERDILLISDEVICGFGRTGHWFGCQGLNVQPDLITFAKGVTGGFQPLGGVAVSDKIADVMTSGGGQFAHGYTYSGHPAPAAAALATLEIMRAQGIVEQVADTLGPYFVRRMQEMAGHPVVGEVRAVGMLAAVELVGNKASKAPLADNNRGALVCRDAAMANGLMVRAVGNAVALCPPLICTTDDIDRIVERLGRALDQTAAEFGIS